MLGWFIHVYKQQDPKAIPPNIEAARGTCIIKFNATGFNSLGWINDLERQNNAIKLGDNGYTTIVYAIRASIFSSFLKQSHLEGDACWDVDIKQATEMLDNCIPDEWLIVEAEDAS